MKRLIIVDDEEEMARVLTRALLEQLPGWSVSVLNTADDCCAYKGGLNVDFILLDMMMRPGKKMNSAECNGGFLTGLLLLKHLAVVEPRARIGVLTAVQFGFLEKVREECRKYQQVRYIWAKPVAAKAVITAIMEGEKGDE